MSAHDKSHSTNSTSLTLSQEHTGKGMRVYPLKLPHEFSGLSTLTERYLSPLICPLLQYSSMYVNTQIDVGMTIKIISSVAPRGKPK